MSTCFHYISRILQFLGMCLKLLQKVAISFQMPACLPICLSVHPSLYPCGTTQLPLSRFLWNLILGIFNRICQPNSSLVQIGQTDTLNEDLCEFMLNVHLWEEYMNYYVLPFKRQVQYSQRSPLHWIKEWFVSLLWIRVHHKFSPYLVTILELSINHCKPGPKIPSTLLVFGM